MEAITIEDEMNTYFAQLRVAEKKSVVQMIKTFLQVNSIIRKLKKPKLKLNGVNILPKKK